MGQSANQRLSCKATVLGWSVTLGLGPDRHTLFCQGSCRRPPGLGQEACSLLSACCSSRGLLAVAPLQSFGNWFQPRFLFLVFFLFCYSRPASWDPTKRAEADGQCPQGPGSQLSGSLSGASRFPSLCPPVSGVTHVLPANTTSVLLQHFTYLFSSPPAPNLLCSTLKAASQSLFSSTFLWVPSHPKP